MGSGSDHDHSVLAALLEHSPDIITRYDPNLRITLMSRAVQDATGVPAERFIGRRLAEVGMAADLVEVWERTLREVFGSGKSHDLEFHFAPPGSPDVLHFHGWATPVFDEAGRAVSVLTMTRNITERKRAEDRLRSLVENGFDLIAIIDESGRMLYASPSHERVLGFPDAAAVGSDAWQLVHREDVPQVQRALSEVVQCGQAAVDNVRLRTKQGTWRTLSIHMKDCRENPAVRGIVLNSRDVTDERALEARLRHAQKMEALGQLAGGVAHDFNNILAAITGFTHLVYDELAQGNPQRADLEEVLRAVDRASAVTGQLVAFSRSQALQTERVNLVEVVHALGRMLERLMPTNIQLTISPQLNASRPVTVIADATQLEQVVMNLALNARDAMPDGGQLSVVVDEVVGENGTPLARILVTDTGVGMSPAVQEHIFEPFFTTKPAGKGSGLGLATSYGIVRQLGGTIEVSSTQGVGTEFRVALPLATPLHAEVPSSERMRADSPLILIVDDEPQLRTLAKRILARAGYEILTAENGEQGLQLLKQHAQRVRLILTDSVMNGGSGEALAERAATLYPGLPILMMSGYGDDGVAEGAPPHGFIAKPFTVQSLVSAVERALGTQSPPAPPPTSSPG